MKWDLVRVRPPNDGWSKVGRLRSGRYSFMLFTFYSWNLAHVLHIQNKNFEGVNT